MARSSSQPTVDKLLGTAAMVSLSIVLIRWISHSNNNTAVLEGDKEKYKKANHHDSKRKYEWMPWWWPIIAIQRWNKQQQNHTNREDEEEYIHQGSCQCGSIKFTIRGQKHLHSSNSSGKIRCPHISTTSNRFKLVSGENHMRFYYEQDKEDDDNNGDVEHDNNDSNYDDHSSVTFEHNTVPTNSNSKVSSAKVFCGNCGVHVFHADKESDALEVNADCLDDEGDTSTSTSSPTKVVYREQSSSGISSISTTAQQEEDQEAPMQVDSEHQQVKQPIETLLEDEEFLGDVDHLSPAMALGTATAMFDSQMSTRKESVSSSDAPTQPESYSVTESDEFSMGSSSLTCGSSLPLYHSALSVASAGAAYNRSGLPPPVPPSNRNPSPSNQSVQTLPMRLGADRPTTGVIRGAQVAGSSWSLASMETNDLDGDNSVGRASTISPTMRDQMKKYLGRHTSSG